MLKNLSKLEVTIEGRVYQLLCEMDSPLPHCEDALCQFIHYVGNIKQQIKTNVEAQQQKQSAEAPQTQVPVEEQPKEVQS